MPFPTTSDDWHSGGAMTMSDSRYQAGCTYRVRSGEFVALNKATLNKGNLIFEIGGVQYNYTAPDAAVVLDAAGAEFVAAFTVGDKVTCPECTYQPRAIRTVKRFYDISITGTYSGAAVAVEENVCHYYAKMLMKVNAATETVEAPQPAAPLTLTVGHTYRTRDRHIVKLQEGDGWLALYRYTIQVNGLTYGILTDGRRALRGHDTSEDLVEFVAPFAVGDEVCVPGDATPRKVLWFGKGVGSGRWHAYLEKRHYRSPGVLVSRLCLHRKTVPLSAARRSALLDEEIAKAAKEFTTLAFTADTYANLPDGATVIGAEKDPNGIAANAPGAKLDAGKRNAWLVIGAFGPGLDLIHGLKDLAPGSWQEDFNFAYKSADKHEIRNLARAAQALKAEIGLDGVIAVGEFGAKKYSPDGWRSVPNGIARYRDAAYRHYADYLSGKTIDDGPGGTNCRHIDQILWNLLACLTLHAVEEKKRNAPAEHVNCRCSAKGVNFGSHFGFHFDSRALPKFEVKDNVIVAAPLMSCEFRLYVVGPVNEYGGRQTPVEADYVGYNPYRGAYRLYRPGRYAVAFVKPSTECVITWMRRTAPDGKDTWLQISGQSTSAHFLVINAATGKLL